MSGVSARGMRFLWRVLLLFCFAKTPCSDGRPPMKHTSRLDTRLLRMMTGKRVAAYLRPAEERGVEGAFESDMRLTEQQLKDILHQQTQTDENGRVRVRRKAVAQNHYLWNRNTVPYQFAEDFPGDYRETVLDAMHFWQRSTCVVFVPYSPEIAKYLDHNDRVLFTLGEGCQSSIGKNGIGEQTTEIAEHCNEFGSVSHEMGHILGFYHEQSRPDRDQFVTILNDNIRHGRQHNFLKYSANDIMTSEPYDIGSVMHYGPTYFSKDGASLTIDTAEESYRAVMGQRNAPSFIDVKTANDMYNCAAHCEYSPVCHNEGYVGPDCMCMCPTGLGGSDCRQVKDSTAECGGVLTDSTGEITSPGYGGTYPRRADCIWLIQAPAGSSVVLTIDYFELEDDKIQPCAFDWLEIRTQGPHLNGRRFCGEGPSESILYHGTALVLHFHSDDTYNFDGFKLRYTIVEGAASQALRDPTGWSDWTPCSVTCDGGTRSRRFRLCHLGNVCTDTQYEEERCNNYACIYADDEHYEE